MPQRIPECRNWLISEQLIPCTHFVLLFWRAGTPVENAFSKLACILLDNYPAGLNCSPCSLRCMLFLLVCLGLFFNWALLFVCFSAVISRLTSVQSVCQGDCVSTMASFLSGIWMFAYKSCMIYSCWRGGKAQLQEHQWNSAFLECWRCPCLVIAYFLTDLLFSVPTKPAQPACFPFGEREAWKGSRWKGSSSRNVACRGLVPGLPTVGWGQLIFHCSFFLLLISSSSLFLLSFGCWHIHGHCMAG